MAFQLEPMIFACAEHCCTVNNYRVDYWTAKRKIIASNEFLLVAVTFKNLCITQR